jgi:hypothetical protein
METILSILLYLGAIVPNSTYTSSEIEIRKHTFEPTILIISQDQNFVNQLKVDFNPEKFHIIVINDDQTR